MAAPRDLDAYKRLSEGDWDILLILDACRFDYFQQALGKTSLKGRLCKVKIPSSTTTEFLELWPTVTNRLEQPFYISGNPWCNSRDHSHKFKVVDVALWGTDYYHQVVLPETISNIALAFAPFDERMIVHYMQPHAPFLGEFSRAKDWEMYRTIRPVDLNGSRYEYAVPFPPGAPNAKPIFRFYPYHALPSFPNETEYFPLRGEHIVRLVRRAYMENLYLVLREVNRLLKYLKKCKVVLTADHGELLGEPYEKGYNPDQLFGGAKRKDIEKWGMWWHHAGFRHQKLNTVPWFELSGG